LGLVRTWKENKLARDTYSLERARLGLVRIWKANKPARDTHFLERAEVGIGQNMKSKQASKGQSLARGDRGWDWLEHRKQTSQQGTLTS